VNGQDFNRMDTFDVFLCHNSEDKLAVRKIWQALRERNIKPRLAEDGRKRGTPLQPRRENIKSVAVFVGRSGLAPWQNQEIQTLLNQFLERGPVIPVVLSSARATPELPWTLANLHWVDFRVTQMDPLNQLIQGINGQVPDLRALEGAASIRVAPKPPLIPVREANVAPDEAISPAKVHPPLPEPADQEQALQLENFRGTLLAGCVNDVLKHPLYQKVLLSSGKRQIGNAVDPPWKETGEFPAAANSAPSDNRSLSAIYETTGLLLILGEPGSGKTTTLLDLARSFLDRARDDHNERVPIVLNLSSWKPKQLLTEWISSELSEKYQVPRKIARFWLERDYLLPLLDGLDEIETRMQSDCVAAINAFIEELKPSRLVVCCRLNQYRWLPKRLKMNGAISLEPLSSEEVSKYLVAGGSNLARLRKAVETDPVLQGLAQLPFMLRIMTLTYEGIDANELARQKGNPEERRKQICGLYLDQMFERNRTISLVFSKEKFIHSLSWLAREMRKHSQSVFLIEGLQPSWLGSRTERAAYGAIVALTLGSIIGLIFGVICCLTSGANAGAINRLIGAAAVALAINLFVLVALGLGCWSESPLKNGLTSGLIAGLLFSGSVSMFLWLFPWSSVGVTVPQFLAAGGGAAAGASTRLIFATSGGLVFGLLFGPIVGLLGGVGVGSLNHVTLVETISWRWDRCWNRSIRGSGGNLTFGLILSLLLGLLFGVCVGISAGVGLGLQTLVGGVRGALFFGLIFWLVSGLVGGFTDPVTTGKPFPNRGIKLSGQNALAAFLITSLAAGLTSGLIIGVSGGLVLGPLLGLIVGLNRGGSAVIKHYALRLTLRSKGRMPFKLVQLLDQCAELTLLQKVGGGYMFVPRILLDYFAEILLHKQGRK